MKKRLEEFRMNWLALILLLTASLDRVEGCGKCVYAYPKPTSDVLKANEDLLDETKKNLRNLTGIMTIKFQDAKNPEKGCPSPSSVQKLSFQNASGDQFELDLNNKGLQFMFKKGDYDNYATANMEGHFIVQIHTHTDRSGSIRYNTDSTSTLIDFKADKVDSLVSTAELVTHLAQSLRSTNKIRITGRSQCISYNYISICSSKDVEICGASQTNTSLYQDQTKNLTCNGHGAPPMKVTWNSTANKNLTASDIKTGHYISSTLTISASNLTNTSTVLTCTITNIYGGKDSKTFTITKEDNSKPTEETVKVADPIKEGPLVVIWILPLLLVLIIGFLVVCLVVYFRRRAIKEVVIVHEGTESTAQNPAVQKCQASNETVESPMALYELPWGFINLSEEGDEKEGKKVVEEPLGVYNTVTLPKDIEVKEGGVVCLPDDEEEEEGMLYLGESLYNTIYADYEEKTEDVSYMPLVRVGTSKRKGEEKEVVNPPLPNTAPPGALVLRLDEGEKDDEGLYDTLPEELLAKAKMLTMDGDEGNEGGVGLYDTLEIISPFGMEQKGLDDEKLMEEEVEKRKESEGET